jgi:hypothetical protein
MALQCRLGLLPNGWAWPAFYHHPDPCLAREDLVHVSYARGLLSPTDISRNVRPESGHTSAWRSVYGYVAPIIDEVSRSRVEDHYTEELQIAVGITLDPVRKETGRGLRVNKLWPKLLNLARENLRSLDS